MVSALIGRGEQERARATLRKVLRVATLATLPIVVVAMAVPGHIFSIFFGITDPGPSAEIALRVVAGAMVFGVPWIVWMGGIQGTGDTPAGSVIDSGVAALILGWAALTALVLGGGLVAVWSGVAVAWLFGLIAAVAWIRSDRWRRIAV